MRMILRSLEGGFPNMIPRMLRGMDSSPFNPISWRTQIIWTEMMRESNPGKTDLERIRNRTAIRDQTRVVAGRNEAE